MALQRRVLRLFRRRGLLDEHTVEGMLTWQASGGFSLDASDRIHGSDSTGRERLLRYCARPPFALERLRIERHVEGNEQRSSTVPVAVTCEAARLASRRTARASKRANVTPGRRSGSGRAVPSGTSVGSPTTSRSRTIKSPVETVPGNGRASIPRLAASSGRDGLIT